MGNIDWNAIEKMCQANHALYTAACEGDEHELVVAVVNGADVDRVAEWIDDENAREFLLTRTVVSSHTPRAGFRAA